MSNQELVSHWGCIFTATLLLVLAVDDISYGLRVRWL